MATKNHKKTIHAEEITRFPGLDASSPFGEGGVAQDIQNFKIMPDGSLQKRDGYATIATFEDRIRAVWVYREGATEYVLAVAGNQLGRVNTETKTVETAVIFSTNMGNACFFEYDRQVYIMDGHDIYHYTGGVTAETVHGYVPLYGKNWSIDNVGNTVHEPINLLSSRVRLSYFGTGTPTRLDLGFKAVSVDSVKLDGAALPAGSCTVSEDGMSLACEGIEMAESRLELVVTVDMSYWYDGTLYTCTRAASYHGFSVSRLFLFGGSDGAVVHSNIPVFDEAMAASIEADAASTGLYIPKDSRLTVGHREVVTAAVGIYDRMMFCTEGGTWLTDSLTESIDREARHIRLGSVSGILGCSAPGALGVIEGDLPVTVTAGGIYRWEIDPTLEKGCIPKKISDPISPFLSHRFWGTGFVSYMRTTNELWVGEPLTEDGRVLIYNCVSKCWYSYVNLYATALFETSNAIGFAKTRDLCLFEAGRGMDLLPVGDSRFSAIYRSGLLEFGDAEAVKKAVRLYLDADTGGGSIEVTLTHPSLLASKYILKPAGQTLYERRFTTPRFQRLTLTLTAVGTKNAQIYRVCLHPIV